MEIQPPEYDKIEKELWKTFATEVVSQLESEDSGLIRRIRTFCDRFGFNEADVCNKIKTDFMFACCFAKNATRTGFHENAAEKYLRMFPNLITSFEALPARGERVRYINESGAVAVGKKPAEFKSLDFIWKAGNTDIKCLAAHKYTRESGGSQDHQRNELISLLKRFQTCDDKNVSLFAICDGPYYTERNLSLLREHTRDEAPYSFACPIGEVPKIVEDLITLYMNGDAP